jgi:hypothetical protein
MKGKGSIFVLILVVCATEIVSDWCFYEYAVQNLP